MKEYMKPEIDEVRFASEIIADLDVTSGEDDGNW